MPYTWRQTPRGPLTKPPLGWTADPSAVGDLALTFAALFGEGRAATAVDLVSGAVGTYNTAAGGVTGNFGPGANFPGTAAANVTTPAAPPVNDIKNTGGTLLTWVNFGSSPSNDMLGYKTNTDAGNGWWWGVDQTPAMTFVHSSSATDVGANTTTLPAANVWVQLAVTWDGSLTAANIAFYQNGKGVASTTTQNGTGTLGTDSAVVLQIGAATANVTLTPGFGTWPSGGTSTVPFTGKMDHFLLFKRVLSANDIYRLYGDPFLWTRSPRWRRQSKNTPPAAGGQQAPVGAYLSSRIVCGHL